MFTQFRFRKRTGPDDSDLTVLFQIPGKAGFLKVKQAMGLGGLGLVKGTWTQRFP
jgi:hypothetical protein